MSKGKKILVVEDDAVIAANIVRGLRENQFEVELATDGVQGLKAVLDRSIDLMVLDINLPGKTGFDVLSQMQSRVVVPVIVLTARADLDDRLKSFQLGAVDYISKPFFMEELLARIRTRLSVNQTPDNRKVINFENVSVDLSARTVTVNSQDVAFTKTEFDILAYLLERPQRAVSRQQLVEAALPVEGDRDERTVDSHVARIRKKLGAEASCRIRAVWGIGYRFDSDDSK